MKLKKIVKEIPLKQFKGPKEIEITGVCANSKLVAPGNLFVARRGRTEDGTKYIPEAILAGAVAVLTDIYDPSLKQIAQLIHPDVSSLEGLLSAYFYQYPSSHLFTVGITGTNGKTTTSFIIKHLLDALRGPCGLIGTIEYILGKHRYQATRTTPDVTANQKMLREMVQQQCQSAVMEVTSHALDQGRVDHVDFDVAVFTNLTLDHLDYHRTMEEYCKAKNTLFRQLSSAQKRKKPFKKAAVVNIDSPWHQKISEGTTVPIFTYGIASKADFYADNIVLNGAGSSFTAHYQQEAIQVQIPLIGRYNVYNALAAMSVALTQGFDLKCVASLMQHAPKVPGRLEPVVNALHLKIYVDFAHTDDALINVFECLKEFKKGRIICVFGCGGDRDQSKRPRMGQAAEEYADCTIITSDNPRSESPESIAAQIAAGFRKKDSYVIELDRREAIAKAIGMADENDIILIAGKGHEPYQIFAHKTIEFDDRKVAAEICQQLALTQECTF